MAPRDHSCGAAELARAARGRRAMGGCKGSADRAMQFAQPPGNPGSSP